MAGNWRKYKKIPAGSCNGNPACKNPTGGHHYCPRHMALYRKAQNSRRAFRRQLGLCIFCRNPAAPGYTRCTRHRAIGAAANQKSRDAEAAKRGWKMVRVPITPEVADGQRRRGPRR